MLSNVRCPIDETGYINFLWDVISDGRIFSSRNPPPTFSERSVLWYSAFSLSVRQSVHLSVPNVKAYYSETSQVIEMKFWEYVQPYHHFV